VQVSNEVVREQFIESQLAGENTSEQLFGDLILDRLLEVIDRSFGDGLTEQILLEWVPLRRDHVVFRSECVDGHPPGAEHF
jgi:hypothetical protein